MKYDQPWLIVFHDSIALDWAAPHFLAGISLFIIGMAVNIDSCTRLLRLKKENPGGYTVPQGGLFRWVSCPHYLGEIIEWFGWALLTWSLPRQAPREQRPTEPLDDFAEVMRAGNPAEQPSLRHGVAARVFFFQPKQASAGVDVHGHPDDEQAYSREKMWRGPVQRD